MAVFLHTLWDELVWVVTPTKYGGIQIQYVDYWNLLYPLPMALGMLSLRFLLTHYCFEPLGIHLGLKKRKIKMAFPNPVLESVYSTLKSMPKDQIAGVAKQLDMSEREVEKWLRLRKHQDRPSVLWKFCENCWRCSYYTCLFTFGLVVLWDKPWLWHIRECWTGYPASLTITNDIWWYYMLSLAFYWSLVVGQFSLDVKRKDFWQMFIHHTAAILLLSFSWLAGVFKIGTLVLLVHDCADIFVEAAKAAKYVKYDTTCTALFSIFTLVWIVTRLGIYPFWIINQTLLESPKHLPNFPAYYTFNILLILLLGLHCFWTYLIVKVAVAAFGAGHVEGDVRSSSEDESGDN
ncbi:ceramide synthase 6-like [Tribolium madens]|uniref:ceramide synthase 6-like n=1 Tax=Tribolium madens TaxID=41895 RepID=UPI001CF738B3|nr:ceramide synthase 6-like [Tribolium madens]